MPKDKTPGKPTTRRYSQAEKDGAVRAVRQLRKELGTDHGTVQRVADQLGYGVETVRKWVRQADVDEGLKAGRSAEDEEQRLHGELDDCTPAEVEAAHYGALAQAEAA